MQFEQFFFEAFNYFEERRLEVAVRELALNLARSHAKCNVVGDAELLNHCVGKIRALGARM